MRAPRRAADKCSLSLALRLRQTLCESPPSGNVMTQPNPYAVEPSAVALPRVRSRFAQRWLLWASISLIYLLVTVGTGSAALYFSGISERIRVVNEFSQLTNTIASVLRQTKGAQFEAPRDPKDSVEPDSNRLYVLSSDGTLMASLSQSPPPPALAANPKVRGFFESGLQHASLRCELAGVVYLVVLARIDNDATLANVVEEQILFDRLGAAESANQRRVSALILIGFVLISLVVFYVPVQTREIQAGGPSHNSM